MLVVANWKMNCLRSEAERLIAGLKAGYSGKNAVVLCPPFTLLSIVSDHIKDTKMELGAQNCHSEEKGAYTGDISPTQLRDIGAKYVIVGHSERRTHYKCDDDVVKKKAIAAIKSGLTPIICIGETGEERKSGKTENVIISQIENSVPKDSKDKYIIAYEPVWAIGTGITPTNDEIARTHALISAKLPGIKILYGGSVNDINCSEIAGISNVSGFLVGGASLDPIKFTKIMNA